MAAIPSESHPQPRRWTRLLTRDVAASVAIAVMWIAVTVTALWGPDIISNSATSYTRLPSAIVVAFFACLATRWVAKYGLGPRDTDTR